MIDRPIKYKRESLGRPAIFYLPTGMMGLTLESGRTCTEEVDEFLATTFGGYTEEGGANSGYWRNDNGKVYKGTFQRYRVSFEGKERIEQLEEFLAYIATQLKQESIYFETGEDAWLIYPTT